MPKSLIIAEEASLATLMDRDKAIEFFFQSNDFALGDIYSARVENILPSIDAVFVNLGTDKMGFLHASDIPGTGPLSERIWPKQKLLVQIVKEPTSNKGPRVSNDITLIGRFFVLTTEHSNIVMSRRIASAQERARLRSIASLLKPPVGFGLIIRTEAMGASEKELEEDFRELFLERWKYIIDQFEIQRRPNLIFSDSRDLLYRVLRDVFHDGVDEVAVDNPKAAERAKHYLELWSHKPPEVVTLPTRQLLKESGVLRELKEALSNRIELPNGGYVHIQATEAMTVVDVNSGKFTSSRSPGETVLKTNLEAATEVARQLRLRNIGGVIVIDFIDMDNKFDRLKLLEHFERLLENDPARPQIGRLSDLGLVELTRHRQEKSLLEALGHQCDKCHGLGSTFHIFDFANEEVPLVQEQAPLMEDFSDNDDMGESFPGQISEGQFNEQPSLPPPPQPQERYDRNRPQNRGSRYPNKFAASNPNYPGQQPRGEQQQREHHSNQAQRRNPRAGRYGQQGANPRYQEENGNAIPQRRPPAIRPQRNANPNFTSISDLENALVNPLPVEETQRVVELTAPIRKPLQFNQPTQEANIIPLEASPVNDLSREVNENVDRNEREENSPPPIRVDAEEKKPERNEQSDYTQPEASNREQAPRQDIVFPTLSLGENTTKEVLPGIFSISSKDDE